MMSLPLPKLLAVYYYHYFAMVTDSMASGFEPLAPLQRLFSTIAKMSDFVVLAVAKNVA